MARALRGRFEPLNHFVLGHLYDPWASLCPWVACCAHQVQNFDLSQTFWCLGFNEQIFRGDEQNPGRGPSDKGMFGPTVSPHLVQSGKGRIASDPALLNLPRPLMVGAFSVPLHFLDNQRSVK